MTNKLKFAFRLNGFIDEYILELNYLKKLYSVFSENIEVTVFVDNDAELIRILSSNQTFAKFENNENIEGVQNYDCVVDLLWRPKVIHANEKIIKKHSQGLFSVVKAWIDYNTDIHTIHTCEVNNSFLYPITQYLLAHHKKIYTSLDIGNYFNINSIEYSINSDNLKSNLPGSSNSNIKTITISCPNICNTSEIDVKEKLEDVCKSIKNNCDGVKIVQLGDTNDLILDNIDEYQKYEDASKLLMSLNASVFHIGVEGMGTHVRQSLPHRDSAAFFIDRTPEVWGYYSNINVEYSISLNGNLSMDPRMDVEDYKTEIIRRINRL